MRFPTFTSHYSLVTLEQYPLGLIDLMIGGA